MEFVECFEKNALMYYNPRPIPQYMDASVLEFVCWKFVGGIHG